MISVDSCRDSGPMAGTGGFLADSTMTTGRLSGGIPAMHDVPNGTQRLIRSSPAATRSPVPAQPAVRALSVRLYQAYACVSLANPP